MDRLVKVGKYLLASELRVTEWLDDNSAIVTFRPVCCTHCGCVVAAHASREELAAAGVVVGSLGEPRSA